MRRLKPGLLRIRNAENELRAAISDLDNRAFTMGMRREAEETLKDFMAKEWTTRCNLALLVLSSEAPTSFLTAMRKCLQAKTSPPGGLAIVRIAEGYGELPPGGIWQPETELEMVRDGVLQLAGNSYTPPARGTCWHTVVWARMGGHTYTDGRTHTYFSLCGKAMCWLKYGLGTRGMPACKRCVQLEDSIVRKEE